MFRFTQTSNALPCCVIRRGFCGCLQLHPHRGLGLFFCRVFWWVQRSGVFLFFLFGELGDIPVPTAVNKVCGCFAHLALSRKWFFAKGRTPLVLFFATTLMGVKALLGSHMLFQKAK